MFSAMRRAPPRIACRSPSTAGPPRRPRPDARGAGRGRRAPPRPSPARARPAARGKIAPLIVHGRRVRAVAGEKIRHVAGVLAELGDELFGQVDSDSRVAIGSGILFPGPRRGAEAGRIPSGNFREEGPLRSRLAAIAPSGSRPSPSGGLLGPEAGPLSPEIRASPRGCGIGGPRAPAPRAGSAS